MNNNPVIIDTNVPLVANNKASQVSLDCVLACIENLSSVRAQGVLVLDESLFILEEYKNKLNPSGQPGPGDLFLRWVLDNWFNPTYCELVSITQTAINEFLEIPPELSLLIDPSDRKFVATHLAHSGKPPIVNAADSDWWKIKDALAANNIPIDFICQAEMEAPRQPPKPKREQKRATRKSRKERP